MSNHACATTGELGKHPHSTGDGECFQLHAAQLKLGTVSCPRHVMLTNLLLVDAQLRRARALVALHQLLCDAIHAMLNVLQVESTDRLLIVSSALG